MDAIVVEFSNISKSYSIYASPGDRLKELATFQQRSYHTDYWALRDISFSVKRGETFCIIGENGCGKSTLLQICAGILQPTSGTIRVHGRVAALLELGAGFNPEFTGRENVFLNGAILGLSTEEMAAKFPDIEQFAEIGAFIDQPVKTYSSGMIVRLAFAVAINVDPDVLLVDEALAVGDIYFRQRCMRKVHELRSRGVTILFVTHATGEVKALGDRALWLERGQIRSLGDPDRVVSQYLAAMNAKDAQFQTQDALQHPDHHLPTAPDIVDVIPHIDQRFGDERAEILGISVTDLLGQPLGIIQPDSSIRVRISARAHAGLDHPIIGVTIRDHRGLDLSGANTETEGVPLPPMSAGDIYTADFHIDIPTLYSLSLAFSPAIANGSSERHALCDWIDNAVVLEMARPEGYMYGHLRFRCRLEVHKVARNHSPSAPAQPQGAPAL